METNVIYCGDNLDVLPEYVPSESVDLIYIDPPFNTSRKYEVFWGEAQERRSFEDRFGDVMTYLDWMRPRIRELYRVLKPNGSFYYHCDWHASHYVKVELDRVFGFNNFQNEIVWYRSYAHNDPKRFGASHDVILFYAKSAKKTWHRLYGPYSQDHVDNSFRHSEADGRRYQLVTMTASKPGGDTSYEWRGKRPPAGRYWAYSKANMGQFEKQGLIVYSKTGTPRLKVYWDQSRGVPLQTVWTDIRPIGAHAKERLGFPTQKPLPLLERILKASSNEGDVVLDAFCGCGTTLEAAATLKRRWIGVDVSPTACRVMGERLEKLGLRQSHDFEIRDMPRGEDDLRRMPHFEFENWAVIALGGIPNRVKVGDYGIDGRLYVADVVKEKKGGRDLFGEIDNWYPIQVKQKDKAGRPDIDNFQTAMRRDRRVKGYFVAFGFSKDAFVEIKRANKHDGLDIVPVTVKEILEHERVAA